MAKVERMPCPECEKHHEGELCPPIPFPERMDRVQLSEKMCGAGCEFQRHKAV